MSAAVPVVVEFLGTTLRGVLKDGVRYVALKPIVEGIGLDWKSQHAKVVADEVIGPTVVEITMVAEDGKKRAMTCIPEEFLQGWMFTVSPGKVKASLKQKVIHYKRECYRVLHEAFNAACSTGGPIRAEYLAGYHELQDVVAIKAAKSSAPWAAHLNVNRAINKAAGIEAGQRGVLPLGKLAFVSVANQVACAAFSAANDHHDGYANTVVALGKLTQMLPACTVPLAKKIARKA
jgi:hypothetical protein